MDENNYNQLKDKRFQKPEGFVFDWYDVENEPKIRFGYILNGDPRKNASIVPGLFESIEKYYELIHDLVDKGFNVAILDLPFQGQSERLSNHSKRRSSKGFDLEIQQLSNVIDHVYKTVFSSFETLGNVLIGHSLGGHLSLRYLSRFAGQHPFQKALLSAPMIGMVTKPWPPIIAKTLSSALSRIGFNDHYVFGEADWSEKNLFFGKKKTSHDPIRAHLHDYTFLQDPSLISSGPTFGWVSESFKSLEKLHDQEALQRIDIPIHLYSAAKDEFVDYHRLTNLLDNIKNIKHTQVGGAAHELFMERDDMRNQILQDSFLNP